MGKSSWNSGPLMRAEVSGNLDANQSNRIFSLKYDADYDDDSVMDSNYGPNSLNLEELLTNKPIVINEYKLTVASNDLVVIHQYYGDKLLEANIQPWNTSENDFHRSLKQWTMVPGSKQKFATSWEDEALLETDIDVMSFGHSNQYAVRSIGCKRRNGARPITLSKNKGSLFGCTVSNLSGNNDAYYYAIMEVTDWAILD